MDQESKEDFEFPVQYMFKDVPKDIDADADPIDDRARRDGPLRHRARR